MVSNFDLWIIVEGSAKNGGSTSWCRNANTHYTSTDGTVEYLKQVQAENENVILYTHHKYYSSKDEQFNKGIAILKSRTDKCYLWQVDADEHWKVEDLAEAEHKIWRSMCNVASFQFNHYVKDGIIAKGNWGSGRVNRLWKWRGQMFRSHEPAVMTGQTAPVELPQKFEHYSMVFEKDVKDKSKRYRGHEEVYKNWKRLEELTFPCHISKLFGKNNPVGRGESYLYKTEIPCANVLNQKAKEAVNQ